jgi:restriction system protein
MTKIRAWKLRPGSDAKTVREVLNTGKILLDYEVPDLRPNMTRKDLINAIRTHNPGRSDKGVHARAGQIETLFNEVRKGDLVLVPRDKGRAMIIGEMQTDRSTVTGTAITVHVNWIAPEVPISRFDQDLQYSFMAIHKFCEVSRNDAVRRLLRIAHGEVDPGYPG